MNWPEFICWCVLFICIAAIRIWVKEIMLKNEERRASGLKKLKNLLTALSFTTAYPYDYYTIQYQRMQDLLSILESAINDIEAADANQ